MTHSDSFPTPGRDARGPSSSIAGAQRLVDESGDHGNSLTWHVQADHYGDLSVLAAEELRARR